MKRIVDKENVRDWLEVVVGLLSEYGVEDKVGEPQVPYDGVMFYRGVPADVDRVVDFYWNSDEGCWMLQGMSLKTGDIDFLVGGLNVNEVEHTVVPMTRAYLGAVEE